MNHITRRWTRRNLNGGGEIKDLKEWDQLSSGGESGKVVKDGKGTGKVKWVKGEEEGGRSIERWRGV